MTSKNYIPQSFCAPKSSVITPIGTLGYRAFFVLKNSQSWVELRIGSFKTQIFRRLELWNSKQSFQNPRMRAKKKQVFFKIPGFLPKKNRYSGGSSKTGRDTEKHPSSEIQSAARSKEYHMGVSSGNKQIVGYTPNVLIHC